MPGIGYNPKITFKKFIIAYIISLIGVILPFTITFIQGYDWPPEVAIWIPLVIAVLCALENAWKHWND